MENKETVEKRRSHRAFFTLDDNIGLKFKVKSQYEGLEELDSGKKTSATLLSLSAGGAGVTGSRYKFPPLKEGDLLTLSSIQTPPPLGVIGHVDAKVKYVITDDYSVRIVVGCEFLDISPACQKRIEEYVAQRLKKNNI